MTSWLKWRLCALLGTSLLVGGATYLRAQDDYPAPARTPEEAGAQFFQLLNFLHKKAVTYGEDEIQKTADEMDEVLDKAKQRAVDPEMSSSAADAQEGNDVSTPFKRSVSRAQLKELDTSSINVPSSMIGILMELMYHKAQERQYNARVSGTEGNQTIVEVAPLAQPRARDVVVVEEDGGYRVDLKATYGLWINKSGEQLDVEWYRYTGVVGPSLRQNPDFMSSRCWSQLRQQVLAVSQYALDYDERLPPARKWIDVLQPYAKSEQLFQCPSLGSEGNGYAYNQYLSQFPSWKLDNAASLINIYETSNPSRNWFGTGTGRAYRHSDGWNAAFADGHVKWFKNGGSGGPTGAEFKPQIDSSARAPFGITVPAPQP